MIQKCLQFRASSDDARILIEVAVFLFFGKSGWPAGLGIHNPRSVRPFLTQKLRCNIPWDGSCQLAERAERASLSPPVEACENFLRKPLLPRLAIGT